MQFKRQGWPNKVTTMKSTHKTKSSRRRVAPTEANTVDDPAILARRLDRLADHNLHLGFHLAAEMLAHRAARLREGAR